MGRKQHTANAANRTATPRARVCLRKGCGQLYTPQRWNQRYCQDAECLRLVRRWQAAQRRAKFRSALETRQKLAAAERQRRQQRRSEAGTAAASGAWSRSKIISRGRLCHRPGCYQSPRDSIRTEACYCGDSCRLAMRRVRDRERKWLNRKTYAGRIKRLQEYQSRNARRLQARLKNKPTAVELCTTDTQHPTGAVVPYGRDAQPLLCSSPAKEQHRRDPETPHRPRTHPPPSS